MSARSVRVRTYGGGRTLRQIVRAAVCSAVLAAVVVIPAAIAETPLKIVALGDSLTAGLGLPEKDGFVTRLQAALTAKGIAAAVVNAGVSGDTTAGGLARLDWSVPEGTDAVILELGANDMLRGFKPQVTREALDAILQRLKDRHIAVLLCGMRAAPNLGGDFARSFEPIYHELAAKYGVLLYPFFLDGVAGDRSLNQHDGLHPTAAGVDTIVAGILPKVEELISRVRAAHPS
ncbi:MAG: arylesterase [Xanthobacteraceae bacterium]